jgi:hypothetical protein
LGHSQPFSGCRKAALFDNLNEVAKLAKVHPCCSGMADIKVEYFWYMTSSDSIQRLGLHISGPVPGGGARLPGSTSRPQPLTATIKRHPDEKTGGGTMIGRVFS